MYARNLETRAVYFPGKKEEGTERVRSLHPDQLHLDRRGECTANSKKKKAKWGLDFYGGLSPFEQGSEIRRMGVRQMNSDGSRPSDTCGA